MKNLYDLYSYCSSRIRFRKNYSFVLKSQWFSREEIERYQNNRLSGIVKHAYKTVPYYRKILEENKIDPKQIQSLADLSLLPITNKTLVKENFDDFKSSDYKIFNPIIHNTSGSTGKPLKILIDRQVESLGDALVWRHYNWSGYIAPEKIAYLRMPFGYRKGLIDSKTLYSLDRTKQIMKINSALLNKNTLKEISELLIKFGPSHIITYPSLITVLGKFLKENRKFKIRLESVIAGGEKLYPFQRELIKDVFECPAFDYYGQWEYVVFGSECEHHNLHVNHELGITEIIKEGKQCKPGETGEIVGTGFNNYSMPLIRYATGDYAFLKNEFCRCNRQMPIIEIVGSREKDLIITKSGIFIMMSGLPLQLGLDYNKIKQIQFYQDSKENLIVRIVRGNNFIDSDIQTIQNGIKDYLLNSINISLEFVTDIPRTNSGKYKYVDSKIPVDFS
ncbi:MAG: hypothetical protein PHG31_00480 [Candidatus Omnitrophica bacterium]|nr:hypothetical protein [Candidatus Omnitrophota bacterium]